MGWSSVGRVVSYIRVRRVYLGFPGLILHALAHFAALTCFDLLLVWSLHYSVSARKLCGSSIHLRFASIASCCFHVGLVGFPGSAFPPSMVSLQSAFVLLHLIAFNRRLCCWSVSCLLLLLIRSPAWLGLASSLPFTYPCIQVTSGFKL